MATLTIRGLDESTHHRLRERAARNGRSMEAEARLILGAAVGGKDLVSALLGLGERTGGVELETPPRTDMPRAVEFE